MSGTELIMGMGEVINYLKGLEEENKKLKEKDKEWKASDKHLNKCIDSIRDQYLELKEENKKLKNDLRLCAEGLIPHDLIQKGIVETCREKVKKLEEENKVSEDQINQQIEWFKEINILVGSDEDEPAVNSVKDFVAEHKKLKNKLNVSEVKRTEAESELDSFHNFTMDYDYEDNYDEWLKGNHDNYSGTWLDNWCSEKLDKYEDGDDWDWGYGYIVKDGEYRIHMAGGGDHWEDYVMDKNGCFIHNKEGKKKVFTFVSCPEGNYIKVWDTPGMDGGLVLDEGETDMYEMVKESYVEEIMNYEPEEEEE